MKIDISMHPKPLKLMQAGLLYPVLLQILCEGTVRADRHCRICGPRQQKFSCLENARFDMTFNIKSSPWETAHSPPSLH